VCSERTGSACRIPKPLKSAVYVMVAFSSPTARARSLRAATYVVRGADDAFRSKLDAYSARRISEAKDAQGGG
jgi:hypothetical protein